MEKDIRFDQHFYFSQNSMSTFLQCPLKFKKRYIENIKWNAVNDPALDQIIEKGKLFHCLAERYFLGLDRNLEHYEADGELKAWYQQLKSFFTLHPQIQYYPEFKIRVSREHVRLEANLDLLTIHNNEITIWDFKTSTKSMKSDIYKSRMQTKVYLWILWEGLEDLFGLDPNRCVIQMKYFRPQSPEILATIPYDQSKHIIYDEAVKRSISEILHYDYASFDKLKFQKSCAFCEFNWFCNHAQVNMSRWIENEAFDLDALDFDAIIERF